jgi:hypothetical protein
MSVPTLTSPYRIGVSPAFVSANAGTTSTKIYGRLPSAPATASGPSDIWPGAAIQGVRNLPTSVFQIAVASDSAQDILTSGSGAWTVQIVYLDANYASQTLNVNLNGQTAVATGVNALRIQSAQVIAAGTGGVNAGNIYVYDATSSLSGGVPQTATKLYAQIATGYNTDGLGMYTVPTGYTAQILHVVTGVTNGTASSYNARVRVGAAAYSGTIGGGTLLPFQYAVIAGPGTTTPNDDLRSDLPETLPAGSEIRFQASSTASGAEVIVIAEILLIPSPASTAQGTE